MTLVVFLRGVNVGGHRTFRPSALAVSLKKYDVVNVGAAGTFVVRKPGSRAAFLAELRRHLPFETEVMLCNGRDVALLASEDPFQAQGPPSDVVRFVGILAKTAVKSPKMPLTFPSEKEWFVRVLACKGKFVFGVYRRHMKTIGYLGRMDKLLGQRVTIRNWTTIAAVARILKA